MHQLIRPTCLLAATAGLAVTALTACTEQQTAGGTPAVTAAPPTTMPASAEDAGKNNQEDNAPARKDVQDSADEAYNPPTPLPRPARRVKPRCPTS
ncbi:MULTISPECIES: hypothetical protein [Streptomyces]|uniref:Lipoprotein n=1 Tax=Streptomyces dengpaensis TaxID=2049881 RepID=A0ABM6T0W0_9ACTN|nr:MULTISPECIES: hypothetical protein [Streptomyces]AVH60590.1 hypothetical protein C4B68_37885 [Streptomyces dengpaensis]